MELVVQDLTVGRGGVPLLSGVSFRLHAGEALVLRGPNGAGKTTLLRTIAGLQPPMVGTVNGVEDRVAYAAHADGVKAMLTVAENLRFWADIFGHKDGIEAALDAFDLTALRERLAGQLSAGQKRRLGLSRLLVTGRPLWVLDEPTVSLDTASVALFGAALQAHLKAGGQAVLASHIDLGFEAQAFDVSDYVADVWQGMDDEAFL